MSAELEALLLGAVLDAEGPVLRSSAGAIIDSTGLRAEDFSDPRVRVAWGVATRMAARRRPVDAVQVYSAGSATRAFGADDLAWLTGLQAANQMDRPRVADLVDNLRSMTRRRSLLGALKRATERLAADGADVAAVTGELEVVLRDATGSSADDGSGDEDVMGLAEDWERQEAGVTPPPLTPTGIAALDDCIGGWPQNLSIVCGLPSVGKSALLASIIDAQLDAGLKVGLFGLEDGTRWLAKRLMARDLAMPVRSVAFAKRTPEQAERFPDVGHALTQKLKGLTCYRHDSVTIDELVRRAAAWRTSRGIDVLYIDHGGEVDHATERFDEYRLRVAESYRRLRNLALRFGLPVVVLAHTGRPTDDIEDRPPRLTEIAESSYIERRARLVLGLWRKREEPEAMRVTVLKQTEGEANVTVKLPRLTSCALLARGDGERVDLAGERSREARAAREKREAERVAAREAAKAAKARAAQPRTLFGEKAEE